MAKNTADRPRRALVAALRRGMPMRAVPCLLAHGPARGGTGAGASTVGEDLVLTVRRELKETISLSHARAK